MTLIPIIGPDGPNIRTPRPIPSRTGEEKFWTFSFRFWKQIEFFGLDRVDTQWVVSVIERLKCLSEQKIEEFLSDPKEKNAWRYHKIDWNKKNIPIQRRDLFWINKDYLDNDDEYPLVQFQISKTMGRIIGFWDENDVFNVVLFDPFHNMQPTKSHAYRVDPCSPLRCDYTSFVHEIDRIVDTQCIPIECEISRSMKSVHDRRKDLERLNIIVVRLTDEQIELVEQLENNGAITGISDVIDAGLIQFV